MRRSGAEKKDGINLLDAEFIPKSSASSRLSDFGLRILFSTAPSLKQD